MGTIFLVAITMTLAATLYAFRPPLPAQPLWLSYQAVGGGSEPVWGDGSDCKNVNGVQTCLTLGVIKITFTNPPPVKTDQLLFLFYCNGTIYLAATLAEMAWVPGSSGTVGGMGPQLQHCGSYTPPAAAWNRLAFFYQIVPGSTTLRPGDSLYLFAHTFTAFKDDDFHGAPEWCYWIPGACTLQVVYTGYPASLAMSLPLYGLST